MLNLKTLMKAMPGLFEHSDKNVRAEVSWCKMANITIGQILKYPYYMIVHVCTFLQVMSKVIKILIINFLSPF